MGRKRRESDVYGVHRFPRATLNPLMMCENHYFLCALTIINPMSCCCTQDGV